MSETTAMLLEGACVRHGAGRSALLISRRAARRCLLVAILVLSTGATVAAMRRTSTTFDEIVMMAGGARGFETGRFDLAPEHPPITYYLYGLPVHLSHPIYPVEPQGPKDFAYRYAYAQQFFWQVGNDPERIAFLGRLVAAGWALLLVLVTYNFAARAFGEGAGVLAAAFVAFLPDVLAHGGVAYNDVPLALLYLAAAWAIDAAVRVPEMRRAVLAGALFALALSVKFNAVLLGPVAVLLLALEALARRHDRAWQRKIVLVAAVALATSYLVLVAVYRGDFGLAELRYGLSFTHRRVSAVYGSPGYLLGKMTQAGWWYFPAAFFFKTPAALHALIFLAGLGLLHGAYSCRPGILRSPLRMPAIAGLVFFAALLTSRLVIGFRYALPALPLLCIVVAVGVSRLWRASGWPVRAAIAALVLWYSASSLSFYPHFLAYTSEYVPSRDGGHEVLLDSSLDWGQGLLELREFMRRRGIQRVYLSYFGSALPAGYGIDYVPLISFHRLLPSSLGPSGGPEPEYAVISATNLHGVYLRGDPFARLRQLRPARVLAHTLVVYRLDE